MLFLVSTRLTSWKMVNVYFALQSMALGLLVILELLSKVVSLVTTWTVINVLNVLRCHLPGLIVLTPAQPWPALTVTTLTAATTVRLVPQLTLCL